MKGFNKPGFCVSKIARYGLRAVMNYDCRETELKGWEGGGEFNRAGGPG